MDFYYPIKVMHFTLVETNSYWRKLVLNVDLHFHRGFPYTSADQHIRCRHFPGKFSCLPWSGVYIPKTCDCAISVNTCVIGNWHFFVSMFDILISFEALPVGCLFKILL